MNKKIALSGLSILTALALVGGAAFAFFSDTGTSSGNTFGAGTLNLQLDDNDEVNPVDNLATATFIVNNMAPGSLSSQEISFHNQGTVGIAEIEMGLTSTNTDAGSTGSDLRNVLDMKVVAGGTASGGDCTGGTDVTTLIDAAVGNNSTPLTMAEFTGDTYDALPIVLAAENGGTTDDGKVCIQVKLENGAGNTYQGDSASATFTFTGNQDTSQ